MIKGLTTFADFTNIKTYNSNDLLAKKANHHLATILRLKQAINYEFPSELKDTFTVFQFFISDKILQILIGNKKMIHIFLVLL